MVHCGYEATAVADTFGSVKAFARVVQLTLLGPGRESIPPDEPKPGAGSDENAKDRIPKIELPVLSS
jgi:hypothetical protein